MKTLTVNEMNAASGGYWQVVGGVIGGIMTHAERADDGDMNAADWLAVGCGVLLGATGDHALKTAYNAAMKKGN